MKILDKYFVIFTSEVSSLVKKITDWIKAPRCKCKKDK